MDAFFHSGKSPGDDRIELHIPSHLFEVQQKVQNLLTLDVHAIAYTTFLKNNHKNINEKDIYEVSYLLAWLYAINSNSYLSLFKNNCTCTPMEVGTCEIMPRKTYTGEVMTEALYRTLEEDEYEDDEDYARRLGTKYKFAMAAEKSKQELNPDEALVSAYLRHGPTSAFRSFIRRSFISEDLVSNCLVLASSINYTVVDKKADYSNTEQLGEKLSLGESLQRCMLMSTHVFATVDDAIHSNTLETEIKEGLSSLKESSPHFFAESQPVISLTKLKIYAPLALFLRNSDILSMIEQAKRDMYAYNSAWKDNPPFKYISKLLVIYANLAGDLVTVELRDQNDITAWLFMNAEVDNRITNRLEALSPNVVSSASNIITFSSSTGNIK